MKNLNYIFAALLAVAALSSSCTKELNLGNTVDETRFLSAVTPTISIRDSKDKAYFHTEEIHADEASISLSAALINAADKDVTVEFKVGDESIVTSYNKKHETSYIMFPAANVDFGGQTLTISRGSKSTEGKIDVKLTFNDTDFTEDFATYVIPVVATTTAEGVNVGDPFLIFAKDWRKTPDNRKYIVGTDRTMTIFNCTEAGTNNILNNLSFRLKNSGQYLIDCVLLFTNDIKYNTATGELEIAAKTGPDAQAGRQESIIDVMHAHGVKVILCLTNFGVTQLDEVSSKEYARKIAQYCEAFNLDGVFFDDEYTKLDTYRPNFVECSPANGARLCYETKMAMPDKMVVTYLYNNFRYVTDIAEVDGVPMKDIVDFALNNYGETTVPKALPASQVAYKSDNFAQSYMNVNTNKALTCTQIKNAGYGAHFFYVLTPGRWKETNEMSQYVRPSLTNICKVWFGDEIVCEDWAASADW